MFKIKDLKSFYKINTYDLETKAEEIWSTKNKEGHINLDGHMQLEEVSKGIYYSQAWDVYYARLGQKWYEAKGGVEYDE